MRSRGHAGRSANGHRKDHSYLPASALRELQRFRRAQRKLAGNVLILQRHRRGDAQPAYHIGIILYSDDVQRMPRARLCDQKPVCRLRR